MKKGNRYLIMFFLCLFAISLILSSSVVFAARSDVETFVTRFYQQCLGRNPDLPGLNGWVDALLNGSVYGADVANGFIFSLEFISRNTSNEEFVTILYRAFFGREPDPGGYNGWTNYLYSDATRQDVINGFLYSREFEILCANYGIIPFSNSTGNIGNDDGNDVGNDDGNDDGYDDGNDDRYDDGNDDRYDDGNDDRYDDSGDLA